MTDKQPTALRLAERADGPSDSGNARPPLHTQGEHHMPVTLKVRVKRLFDDATLPTYASDGSACFDLHAYISDDRPRDTAWEPAWGGPATLIARTGLAFEVPDGHVMLIFSRSGMGFKHDIRLANCVGVIDSDYRGEVMVKLTRDTGEAFSIVRGQRIAQALVLPLPRVQFEEVDRLSPTARGAGGFGSTGKE